MSLEVGPLFQIWPCLSLGGDLPAFSQEAEDYRWRWFCYHLRLGQISILGTCSRAVPTLAACSTLLASLGVWAPGLQSFNMCVVSVERQARTVSPGQAPVSEVCLSPAGHGLSPRQGDPAQGPQVQECVLRQMAKW